MRGPTGAAEPGSRVGEGASAGQTGLITGLALEEAPGNLLLGLGGCMQLCLLQMELGDGCGDGCWIQGSLLPRGKWGEKQPIPSIGKDPACEGIATMLTLATIESGVERRLRHVAVHLELVSARSTPFAISNNTTREPNFGAPVWHVGLGQESWRAEVEFLTTQNRKSGA